MEKKQRIIREIIKYLVIYIIATIIIRYVVNLNYIPSSSMEPSINTGSYVIATPLFKEINRYDVMCFVAPDERSVSYIKRVIGLPGEHIEIKEGSDGMYHVYADNVLLDDSFIKEEMQADIQGVSEYSYDIPENCYFMLGDNRNNSFDARYWKNKYVPREDFISKALIGTKPFCKF